jgi:hypothetical protein
VQHSPETGQSEWTTVASIGLGGDLDAIMLESLRPTVQYEVRAIIREKDNQTILDGVLYSEFITAPCTKIGNLNALFFTSYWK